MSYFFDIVQSSNIDKFNNPAPFTYTGPVLSNPYLEERILRAAEQIFDGAVVAANKGWTSFSTNRDWLPLKSGDVILDSEKDDCGLLRTVLKQRGIDFKCTAITPNKPYADRHFHEFSWQETNPYLYHTWSIPLGPSPYELTAIGLPKNRCGAPRPLEYDDVHWYSKDFEDSIVETANEIYKEVVDKAKLKRVSLQKDGDWISLKPGVVVTHTMRNSCWRLKGVLEQRDIILSCKGITPSAPYDIHSHEFSWHPDNPYIYT